MSTPSAGGVPHPPVTSLADRLVAEATALVAEQGPGALSLREVQRRAGVSPAAAYRHFRDRQALLVAVAQQCAGALADHIAAALEQAPPADGGAVRARARLLLACEAYLDFAATHPGLYRTVFLSGEQVEELSEPSARAQGSAGEGGYNLLVASLRDVVVATSSDHGAQVHRWDPLVVWSCCHGLAMLRLDAALSELPDDLFAQARARVLSTVVAAVPADLPDDQLAPVR